MNDPHVELLIYTAAPSKENIYYKDPPPIAFDNDLGPITMFNVTPGQYPSGTWSLRCATEAPGTGALWWESFTQVELP